MHHDTDLINIVAVGLGLAFIFGALANKLRLSPLVGYLVAGICVGPFTPGFVADSGLANELAEGDLPFGDTPGVGTGRNWAHVNAIDYDADDDSIIVSAHHQGVLNIGRDKQ